MHNWIKTVFKSSSVPYIWKWSKKQHKFVLLTSIINVLYAGLSLVFSLVTKEIVDSALLPDIPLVIKYAALLALIILVQLGLTYTLSRLNAYIKAKMQMSMRREVLDQILKKEYKDISSFHSGELVNRMFSDVNTVIDGVTSIIPPLLCMITQLVGAIIILAGLDYRFVIVLCGVGLIALVVTLLFKKKMKQMHKDVQSCEGKVHAVLQETIENTKLIKASGIEESMENVVADRQTDFYNHQMKRNRFTSAAGTGLRGIFNASWLFAIVWGCIGIATGQYSYGTLMAIMQLVGQIQSPFRNLSGTLQQIYGTISSGERLLEIFDLPNEENEEFEYEDGNVIYNRLKDIKIRNMYFSYNDDNSVLENVNINMSKGDFIAFTGLSGGGKSTLFSLLLGIYKPNSGAIEFVEENKITSPCKKMRSLFAYVPQGNAIFSGTIRENLTMFNTEATEKELYKACEIADIKSFIEELPEGLDSRIGERGLGISEGQSQRLAIARAIVSNAPILLLDEATSALDEMTEATVLKNISNMNNKTCFIVTHRRAAFNICNKRFHLQNNHIYDVPLDPDFDTSTL